MSINSDFVLLIPAWDYHNVANTNEVPVNQDIAA